MISSGEVPPERTDGDEERKQRPESAAKRRPHPDQYKGMDPLTRETGRRPKETRDQNPPRSETGDPTPSVLFNRILFNRIYLIESYERELVPRNVLSIRKKHRNNGVLKNM